MDKAITEKNYRKIDTKFFNMHFSVPRKDGKYKPEGMFYCADKEQAIERLMFWGGIGRNEAEERSNRDGK